MKTIRLTLLGMAGILMLSTTAQADEASNTVTSERLREQSRQYAAESGRSLGVDNAAIQVNETQVMQSGSRTGTPVQTRQQTRTREQKQLRKREHANQGSGSGSRYGRGFESRGGYGGGGYGGNRSGAGGSSRSGGQGGGRR